MSIASEIQRLSGVRSDIFTSITNKGVTVPETATFSSCPTLIDSIQGGGGEVDSPINSSFSGFGHLSGVREFTATQNVVVTPHYETLLDDYTVTNLRIYDVKMGLTITPSLSAQYDSLKFYYTKDQWAHPMGTQGYVYTDSQKGIWQILEGGGNGEVTGLMEFLLTGSVINETTFYAMNCYSWGIEINSNTHLTATGNVVTAYTSAYPYPQYGVTTTGTVNYNGDLFERWNKDGQNWVLERGKDETVNVVYDDGPTSSTNTTGVTALNLFKEGYLKDTWAVRLSSSDTNYTYTYGTSASGYSGYAGV